MLFQKLQPVSTALRFGETYTHPVVYLTATAHAALDLDIVPHLATATGYHASMAVAVDFEISAKITTAHDNRVNRAPHLTVAAPWQSAAARRGDIALTHRRAAHRETSISSSLAAARPLPFSTRAAWLQAGRRPLESVLAWTSASRVGATLSTPWRSLRPHQPTIVMPWSIGAIVTRTIASAWQDRQRHPRPELRILWGAGQPISLQLVAGHQVAQPLPVGVRIPWQAARHPPPGISIPISIGPPIPPPCYTPSATLRFCELASTASLDLRFRCPNVIPGPGDGETIVIPILRTYIVVNDIALIRRENSLHLPALALSINIDAESWTWGWQARLPAKHLDDVLPASPGAPVEFEAVINGVHWYLLAEKVQRDRSFPQGRIVISGRGIAAELGAPYAAPVSRTNAIDRNAQQLMDDALMINGVGIGWTLDWNLTDWLVPAGIWSHTGSHIEAVARIAEAAGGYVQAHRTSKILSIKHRYQVAPWAWNTVTPDFSLPAAVTTKESVSWIENPDYNAVWISGESAGVLASVTRQGTAGDIVAPMIVDALTTHADAARQRGTTILGAAGRQQLLTLETPILSGVGIYPVGSFVQFADGANSRLGIVRSLAINAGKQTRQTIEVECHA